MLRPGGAFFLAIENQLGLKYLAGVPEDHANIPFFGVNDRYASTSVVTFPRAELEARLAKAGYAGRELFIPLPDYKLVYAMLHPAGLAAPPEEFDPTLLVIKNLPPMLARSGVPVFSIEQASRVMVRGRLTADLANSFLFVASTEPEAARIVDPSILAVHYGNFPRADYAKETVFRRTGEGVVVRRRRLEAADASRPPKGPYAQILEDEPYARGSENMHDALIRAVNTPGWNARTVAGAVRPWTDWLASRARPGGDGRMMLAAEYLDAALTNIVLTPDGPAFIDREWSEGTEVELAFVIFRNLFSSLAMITSAAAPAEGTEPLLATLTLRAMTLNGLMVPPARLGDYYERAIALGRQVYGNTASRKRLEESRLLVRPL
jgi:hypothetical protein